MFIVNIKRQQHCCEVENGIIAIWSGPDFAAKKPSLNECNWPRKILFKRIES